MVGPSSTSEANQDGGELTSYQRVRDEHPALPAAVRSQWKSVDNEEQRLRQEVEATLDNSDLVGEVRAAKAKELFESRASSLHEKRQQVRESLERASEVAYKSSIPIWLGMTLQAPDTQSLIADQQASGRLVRIATSKAQKAGKLGFSVAGYLTEQYQEGMHIQGPAGASLVRATLMAAEELGIPQEDILRYVRQPRHEEYLDKSRQLEYMASMHTRYAPEMPKRIKNRIRRLASGSTNTPSAAVGTYQSSAALVGGEREQVSKTEASHSRGGSTTKSRKKRSFK
jgi:hypothetical protein